MPPLKRKMDAQGNVSGAWYLRPDQMEFLRWRSYSERISQSKTLREALDILIEREGPIPPTHRQKASSPAPHSKKG